jgi:hypothetical protein
MAFGRREDTLLPFFEHRRARGVPPTPGLAHEHNVDR